MIFTSKNSCEPDTIFKYMKNHKAVCNDILRTDPRRPQQQQQEPLRKPECLLFPPDPTHFLLLPILDQNRHSTNERHKHYNSS